MVLAARPRPSRSMRYRTTTMRLKARWGSEQYHATTCPMAYLAARRPQTRREAGDVRLLSTADLEWSRSGNRSTLQR